MNNSGYFQSGLFVLTMLVFFSCKKNDNTFDGNSIKGSLSVEVHVKHHSYDVAAIMVYLKKDATEFPGRDSSTYNFKGQTDGYGKVTFENLFPGKYYVYASGFDAIWNGNVFGYAPLSLYSQYTIDNHAYLTLLVNE